MPNPYQDYVNRVYTTYRYGGMNIPDLSRYGALPTEQASSYYGGLPGDSDDEAGFLDMASYGIKEGLGGPLVGLAERVKALPEGSRQRLREEFERVRLEYLAGNPGPWRTFVAGASEILPGVVPYLPAAGVGAAAAKLGVTASTAARGAAIAEGALVGLGESVGQGPGATIGATLAGAALGSIGGGAGAKFQLNRADKEVGAVGKALDKYFSIDKGLPPETVDIRQRAIGEIKVEEAKANAAIKRLQKLTGGDRELEFQVNAALSGDIPMSDLKGDVRTVAQEMRDHIDSLSDKILGSDLVPDSLKDIIRQNRGRYQHTSHEAFDNRRFKEFILGTPEGQSRWDAAYDHLQKENPDWSPQEVHGYMMTLVDRPDNPMRYAGAGEVDGRIFQHKNNIADPVRELMGVYHDPAVNYLKSISFMSSDLAYQKAINEMRDVLVNAGIVAPGRLEGGRWIPPSMDQYKQVTALEGRRMPSAERPALFATPEGYEILNSARETTRMTVLPMVNLWTHVAKTVLSPQTHARNFLSGLLMITMQGHNPFSPSTLKMAAEGAFRYGRAGLDINSAEAKEIADTLRRNNILGAGPKADLERYKQLVEMRLDAGPMTKARKKVYEVVKLLGDKAGSWYQAEDDFWKVFMFKKERDRYVKAGLSFDDAHQRAIQRTRDSMQIYSLIPEGVKKIRDFPLVGPFVSFPSEIVRNVKNSMKNALVEMADPNPNIRRIGAQRLGGILAATTAVPMALSQAGRFISGSDEEQEQAMREFMAPWTESSQFSVITKAPGKATYIDLSFMDPYNYVKKPVLAVLNGMAREGVGGFEALWEGAKEAAEPWLGPEIAVSEMLNFGRTLRSRGEAPAGYLAKEAAVRAYRAAAPGVVVTGERILRGANIPGVREHLPKYSRYGREYLLPTEAIAVVGPRLTTLDFKESFKYRATDFTRARSQASAIYREEARSVERGPLKKIAAKETALETYRPAAETLIRKIDAARRLGVTDQDMLSILANLGVSKADARLLLAGRVPQLRLKESSL